MYAQFVTERSHRIERLHYTNHRTNGGPYSNIPDHNAATFRVRNGNKLLNLRTNLDHLERAQRLATRLVRGLRHVAYEERFSSQLPVVHGRVQSIALLSSYRSIHALTSLANTRAGQSERRVLPAPIRKREWSSRLSDQRRDTTELERQLVTSFRRLLSLLYIF